MFGKLKEKLKSWITKSKKEIEEKSEKVEKTVVKKEKVKKPKTVKSREDTSKKPLGVLDKELGKAEDITEKDEAEILSEKPAKEVAKVLEQKPDETAKDVSEKIDKVKQEIDEVENQIKQTKKQEIQEVPTKFNAGLQGYEPDIEEIKEKQEEIEEEQVEEKIKETEEPEKKGFFSKLKSSFIYKISEEEFKDIFEDLEFLLLENNVALEVVEDIKLKLSEKLIGREIKKENLESEIKTELKNSLNEILIEPDDPLDIIKQTKKSEHRPFVILFFGINGTGKTTSIAKITNLLQKNKLSVCLAAGDTFRAASIEQIQIHADKLKVPLIKQDYHSDPSAVAFDAIKYAKKHKIDVVLIDTAGRMHTRKNLIAEMEKIVRVTKPDLKIFVAESIAGNDATEQAKTFHQAIEVDGSILSKADIDEKGGTIISVSHATNKPIFYLGTGQEYKDIQLFDKQKFIKELGL
tara:strand:- start:11831 stop:13222 length:1392 start_codon:yes stop_codon:yes gene_type:complete